jgi:starvation-inducible DNA-binding protein
VPALGRFRDGILRESAPFNRNTHEKERKACSGRRARARPWPAEPSAATPISPRHELPPTFALYLKTRTHWHMSGPHFRDYHVLRRQAGGPDYAMADLIAERVRKVGASTLR